MDNILKELIDLILEETDNNVLNAGRERQSAVWEKRDMDYLPIIVNGTVPERDKYPKYDMQEQFYSPEKMLCEQLWSVLAALRGQSDILPSVRVNFGTAFLPAIFGLTQEITPDKMPWLKQHLDKKSIMDLSPEKLEPTEEKGLMPECRKYTMFYRDALKNTPVKIFLPDTQGVFDIAHLVMGNAIFTELYDDTECITHLLSLSSYVYKKASLLIKKWVDEPLNSGYHGNSLFMSGCGVRSCEDTTTLISPKFYPLIMPFLQNSLSDFGGLVHFCGGDYKLLEELLKLPEVKGINFGNPERFEWNKTINKISGAGKIYYGTVFRNDGEKLPDYIQRVLSPLKRKGNLIFTPVLNEGEKPGEVISLWHHLQDKHFA